MSSTIYLISDHHFGHENILKFTRADGSYLRSFASVEEMDEFMIEAWNSVVRPQDHVYHLGDVAMKQQSVNRMMPRLNGHKRLVRGNHDIFDTKMYMRHFDEIYGVRVFDKLLLSHIPVHPESIKPGWTNVHGHLHSNSSYTPFTPHLGPRYYNVSVEVLNYVPRSLEQVREEIKSWTEESFSALQY